VAKSKDRFVPRIVSGPVEPWQQLVQDYVRRVRSFCLSIPEDKVAEAKKLVGGPLGDPAALGIRVEELVDFSLIIKRESDTGSSRWVVTEMPKLPYVEAGFEPSWLDDSPSIVVTLPDEVSFVDWLGYSPNGGNLDEWADYPAIVEWLKTLKVGNFPPALYTPELRTEIFARLARPETGIWADAFGLTQTCLYFARHLGESGRPMAGVIPDVHRVMLFADQPMRVERVLAKGEEVTRHRDLVEAAIKAKKPVPTMVAVEHGLLQGDRKQAEAVIPKLQDLLLSFGRLLTSLRNRSHTFEQDIELDWLTILAVKKGLSVLAEAAIAIDDPIAVRYARAVSMFPEGGRRLVARHRVPGTETWPANLAELAVPERAPDRFEKANELLLPTAALVEGLRTWKADDKEFATKMRDAGDKLAGIPRLMGSEYCSQSLEAMLGVV
jgi:hypothetical protein